jgi:phosphatidate cytidylyltransferase
MAAATPAGTGPWRDLRTRLLSVLVLGPMVLGCIWAGGPWFLGMMALTLAGLAWEWVRLSGGLALGPVGLAMPAIILLAAGLAGWGLPWLGVALLLQGAWLLWRLAGALPRGFLALGVVYLGLFGVAFITLRLDPEAGRANVFFLMLLVWASDSAAYIAGRALGGPKLWPAISPGKTWSGALGGLLGAMLVGGLAAILVAPAAAPLWAALVAGVLGVVSQAGDLLESGIKRRFGVKDSSHLIPGHGGLLDRLDGFLAAAPLAVAWSMILGTGVYLWR